MSNVISRSNAESISIGRNLGAVTGVRLFVGQDDEGNDIVYEAGNTSGCVIDVSNPMGSQVMANMILSQLALRGFQYQAFEASALIDPASEIGDPVTVDGNNSIIHSLSTDHSALMLFDASAPFEEEVNHEYKFEPKQEREYQRQFRGVRSTLSIQATEIAARVTQTGGNNSSFGWSLLATEFGLYSGNRKVFWVNSSGAHVEGEITATSGVIGGAVIRDGVLQINSANIGEINASKITAGYLNVDRIEGNSLPGNKIVDTSIPYTKYGLGSVYGGVNGSGVATGAIAPSTVAYGNAVFTGTLDQVGVNKSNIEAMNGYFTGSATFSNLKANVIWLGNKSLYFDANNYVRGQSYE